MHQINKANNNKKVKNKIKIVRIHSSGDFYSKEYFKAWLDIVASCKDVKFFTYSKSFENVGVVPDNLNIIDSIINYNNKNYLNYGTPEYIKKLKNKIGGFICPYEKIVKKQKARGIAKNKRFSCASCKYCFDKKKVLFNIH